MSEPMTDIHDIRPPVMVGLDPETARLGMWVLGGAAVLLAVIIIVRYLWKRRKKQPPADVAATIPPYETAIRSLDRLALDPGNDAKAFYFDLGHTLKAYLGGSFGLNCLEMTTPELIRSLKTLPIPDMLKRDVAVFQDLCDPFRYAPPASELAPDRNRVTADLDKAKELISAIETDVQARQGQAETIAEKEVAS
ncbi:MAG: DUF4381 domain-containing protein [Desulfobacterales bacterium]|nr:DUF4381 domain-containing protein [Desulfobacterales bacterium]